MPDPRLLSELQHGGEADRWLNPNFGGVSYGFGMTDDNAVQPHLYLNHLLNLAELRKFKADGVFFDDNLLRELRDSTTDFATVGKVTAQHLPLPRPDLIDDDYTYNTGAQTYRASEITPAFHSSPKFLYDNVKDLPISDFQNIIVATRINKERKSVSVEKISTGLSACSIVRYIKSPTEKAVFHRQFDNTVHGVPWSVEVYTDAAKPNTHSIEFIVNTAEQVGSRREATTPYVVKLEADHETMEKFIDQLKKATSACKSTTQQHKLLYYLTSVLYFQSDPEFPYVTPDIKPGDLNKDLPWDLFNVPLAVDKIDEIPAIFDRALKNPDGLAVVADLYNEGIKRYGGAHTLAPVIAELRRAFGSDYEQLAYTVKEGIKKSEDRLKKLSV